jgi:hypothetical protein
LLAIVQEQEGDQAGMLQTLRAALHWWRNSMTDVQPGAEHPEHWLLSVRDMPVPAAAGSHFGYDTICCDAFSLVARPPSRQNVMSCSLTMPQLMA